MVCRSSAPRTDQPGATAMRRRRGTQLANSRRQHATAPWRWRVSTCVRCDPPRQALALEMEMPEPQEGRLGALVHCHQRKGTEASLTSSSV
jgi:hypothetical protein